MHNLWILNCSFSNIAAFLITVIKMADDYEKDDESFNPMKISKFQNKEECAKNNVPQLYDLAMSNFKQQNMTAWRPIPTLLYTISIFLIIIAIGIAFGVPLLSIHNH